MRLSLSLLSLQLCSCFDFCVLISQKINHGKIPSGAEKVSGEECLVYQATF